MTFASPCDPTPTAARFVATLTPPAGPRDPAYWFAFLGDQLVFRSAGENVAVLTALDLPELGMTPQRTIYLGFLEQPHCAPIDCYATELAPDATLPPGFAADGLRGVYPRINEALFNVASRAVQLLAWDRTNRFCGQCGAATENAATERAKRCPACGLVVYPRLSPAIIIAIVRHFPDGPRLLMARNHRFPPGRYSVLAGYVEPGESLEECAAREVCEETGITIRNLRYFASQPWPFPNSLMLAFTAEYAGGDIRLEESELAEADWFAPAALPGLPPPMSVARRLIDWFVQTYGS